MSYFQYENHQVSLMDDRVESNPVIAELFKLKYNKQSGDIDGRKRYRGYAELAFIYYMTEYPPLYKIQPSDRRAAALINAGLPEDYSISSELEEALAHIEEETSGLVKSTLVNASNMMHNFNKTLLLINRKLSEKMVEMEADDEVDEADIDIVMKTMDKGASLVKRIEDLGLQLKSAEKKFNDELSDRVGNVQLSEWETE